MGILTDSLDATGVAREVWEGFAAMRGTSIQEAEAKAKRQSQVPPSRTPFPCNGERVSASEAAIITGRQRTQIYRWIRMGAVHVYSQSEPGRRGKGAETVIDLGSLRGAIDALDSVERTSGSHAIRKAVSQKPSERVAASA